jgi:hypothetical protein
LPEFGFDKTLFPTVVAGDDYGRVKLYSYPCEEPKYD